MTHKFPEELQHLITHLKKLPGVGTRTAERFAFEFVKWPLEELFAFGSLLSTFREKIPPCPTCGCLTDRGSCFFCNSTKRDPTQLCLLASPRDAYAIEETQSYRGLYHVVEHLLSPLDGRHAHELKLERIEERIAKQAVREMIIAFDSTLEGDTTALYLKQHFAPTGLKVSRLAFGLPLGSSLEAIDGATLTRALQGRQSF